MPAAPAKRRPILFDLQRDVSVAARPDEPDPRRAQALEHVRNHHAHAVFPQLTRSFARALSRGYHERAAQPQDDAVLLALLHYAELTPTPVIPSVSRIGRERRYRVELRFVIEKARRGVEDNLRRTRAALVALMKPHIKAHDRTFRRWQVIRGAGCHHQFAEVTFTGLPERAKDRVLDLLADGAAARPPARGFDERELTVVSGLAMLRLFSE